MAVDVMAAKPNSHNIFVDCITTCISHISCIYVHYLAVRTCLGNTMTSYIFFLENLHSGCRGDRAMSVYYKPVFFGNKNMLVRMFNTGTEAACLKVIFIKFACSVKKVPVRHIHHRP